MTDSYEPRKGDVLLVYRAGEPYARIAVKRVSQGRWADIEVYTGGSVWTKRQPLPWAIRDSRLTERDGEYV